MISRRIVIGLLITVVILGSQNTINAFAQETHSTAPAEDPVLPPLAIIFFSLVFIVFATLLMIELKRRQMISQDVDDFVVDDLLYPRK
jgi:hypothetical protein